MAEAACEDYSRTALSYRCIRFAGVGIVMGGMCLVEVYKIYTLMEQRQLHTHPLFENARSWGRQERDRNTYYFLL